MTLHYSRPRVRGRGEIFGGLVRWGEVWTPGANAATVLELSRNVTIEGQAVPAGRWSVWMVVREDRPWEMVLDPRADLWHTAHPSETGDQIRVSVSTESTEPVEALLWYFPEVRHSGVTLVMAWQRVRIPIDIEVEPTHRYTMSEAEARPFVGAWQMERVRGRSTGDVRRMQIVHHEDNSLRARIHAQDAETSPTEWVLQPQAEGIFAMGTTRYGELWSNSGAFLEMANGAGIPTTFVIRNSNDQVTWEGRKVQ